MAESQLTSTIDTLFRDMDQFVSTKTVVGEPVQVGDTIIVPLIDMACGMATGDFTEGVRQKHRGGGGISTKISPSAILIVQEGVTKLVNVKNQGAIAKVVDMTSDFINKFLRGKPTVSEETVRTARNTAAVYSTGRAEHMDVKQESRAAFLHMMEYSLLQNGGDNQDTRRMCGLMLLCSGMGMVVLLFISETIFAFLFTIGCLVLGCNLLCC